MTVEELSMILEDIPKDCVIHHWEKIEFWSFDGSQLYGEISTGQLEKNPKYQPRYRVKSVEDQSMLDRSIRYFVTNEEQIYYCLDEESANLLCEKLNEAIK